MHSPVKLPDVQVKLNKTPNSNVNNHKELAYKLPDTDSCQHNIYQLIKINYVLYRGHEDSNIHTPKTISTLLNKIN
jgi:hypothetical protein